MLDPSYVFCFDDSVQWRSREVFWFVNDDWNQFATKLRISCSAFQSEARCTKIITNNAGEGVYRWAVFLEQAHFINFHNQKETDFDDGLCPKGELMLRWVRDARSWIWNRSDDLNMSKAMLQIIQGEMQDPSWWSKTPQQQEYEDKSLPVRQVTRWLQFSFENEAYPRSEVQWRFPSETYHEYVDAKSDSI